MFFPRLGAYTHQLVHENQELELTTANGNLLGPILWALLRNVQRENRLSEPGKTQFFLFNKS